jgi:uncharacterized OB-fold protein
MKEAPSQGRARPAMNQDTEFFWEAAGEHRLCAQRCCPCGRLRNPPGPACPVCHSLDWEVHDLSGRGTLYSYTVVHYPKVPGFDEPAVVAVIDLEEGLRLVSNLIGVPDTDLRIGLPVEVYFVDQAEGWTAPQFRVRT